MKSLKANMAQRGAAISADDATAKVFLYRGKLKTNCNGKEGLRMTDTLYTVTVKYQLHHSRGQLIPSVEDVQLEIEKALGEGDEIMIDVSWGKRWEGCRVQVDEVEIQEARYRKLRCTDD
jgi:hypothetical protein